MSERSVVIVLSLLLAGCRYEQPVPIARIAPPSPPIEVKREPSEWEKRMEKGGVLAGRRISLNAKLMKLAIGNVTLTGDCMRVDASTWDEKHCDERIEQARKQLIRLDHERELLDADVDKFTAEAALRP